MREMYSNTQFFMVHKKPSTGKNETEKSPYSDGLNALTIHTNHDYETHE